MEVGTEEVPLSIEGDGAAVGDMTTSYGFLKRAEIMEEITLVNR